MWCIQTIVIIGIINIKCVFSAEFNKNKFPDDFLFGVASSAYQIEGGHNANGKGESIWDYHTKKNPKFVFNSSNGNIACDSYKKYKEDVKLVKELGVNFYRFSISWTRILPNGYANKINPDGIKYYNNLINELLKNDIQPMVTIFHWDMPHVFEEMGGFTNPFIAYYFEDYARVLFENFGDRVKYWITFNFACPGYGDKYYPPFINQPGTATYLCKHVSLLSHAKAYHLYDQEFRPKQKGKIGMTVDARWYEAASNSKADMEAAERVRQFYLGGLGNPVFHINGDYPEIMKNRVAKVSKEEGYTKSRLPSLSQEEIYYIQGTYDFIGLNIYTTFLVKDAPESKTKSSSYEKDLRVNIFQNQHWPGSASSWLKVTPSALRNILKWFKDQYDNPEIFVTENGYSDKGELDDVKRIDYFQQYMSALLDAIYKDNVTVKGYAAWSLMDNFEWLKGYSEKFGLYHVDFNDPNRKRTAKKSAKWYAKVVQKRKIVEINDGLSRLKGDL